MMEHQSASPTTSRTSLADHAVSTNRLKASLDMHGSHTEVRSYGRLRTTLDRFTQSISMALTKWQACRIEFSLHSTLTRRQTITIHNQRGIGSITNSKNITLFWWQPRHTKTILLDKSLNIGLTWMAPGSEAFMAYLGTMPNDRGD